MLRRHAFLHSVHRPARGAYDWLTADPIACSLAAVRRLIVLDCGVEGFAEAFSRDHLAICRVAREGRGAILLMRRAASDGVSLGRFHRRPPGDSPLARRLSGGRVVAIGPGILSLTAVFPSADWLALTGPTPGPDQMLNRALRPLLSALRAVGADAFYGGRDLVTWEGGPIAVASFTALPDGVIVVEAQVALSTPFDRCTALLAQWDPQGLVLHDASVFAATPPLERRLAPSAARDWPALIAEHAESTFGCEASVNRPPKMTGAEAASARAFSALQEERSAVRQGWVAAAAFEMLGVVEAAALLERGRIAALEISGDLIATYASITEIEDECVGQPPSRAAAERALLRVLSRPGRFVLGARDLAGLIARLA